MRIPSMFVLSLLFLAVLSMPSQKERRCEEPCRNMYKNCGGYCNKKHGHLVPHCCNTCHFRWSLSPIELAEALHQREAARSHRESTQSTSSSPLGMEGKEKQP
jgi:hypothetical protein